MKNIQLSFEIKNDDIKDIFVAELSEIGFEGFEEQEHTLLAYINSEHFDENAVLEFSNKYATTFEKAIVEDINWNAKWEKDFQPVIVDDFCTVRADFHQIKADTTYEIIITPKMSFGTGHHATTQLMIKQMKHLPLVGTKVIDFGTGTGVLAILAEKLGAANIEAIDNDEWSVTNAIENVERNSCKHIKVALGSLEDITQPSTGIILANINRHILLRYMDDMYNLLGKKGQLLMSGLLKEDKEVITDAATKAGFYFKQGDELNNWIVLLFEKL